MFEINIGSPIPLGSSITAEGVNFSIVASNAEYVEILIFNNKNSSLNPSLGWAEFDNKLIDDDPLQSLIENHTWGKIKNTPRRIKNFVK